MEARTDRKQGSGLALIFLVVLLIRLPFLNQAIQGDDVYYLAAAEHAQIDPWHPNHVRYLFQGREVDFRGYPHPPLNAWILGLLLATLGSVREIPFHLAYLTLSMLAAAGMYALARRFTDRPLWATLLFLAVPAFVVNGNSFESDVPFLAFWLAGIALFLRRNYAGAAVSLALAGLAAFQAVLACPILALYTWQFVRSQKRAWLALCAPIAAIAAWQFMEYFATGQFPASVAFGYQVTYGYQRLQMKLLNAGALAIHSLFLVFPLLIPPALVIAWRRRDRDTVFLAGWIAIFFMGAVIFFFAGSARYLLPMAAPVAILASRVGVRWLWIGFAAQMALSLGLAVVNYQHWDSYRRFAAHLPDDHRIWADAEWGLRFYLEQRGALPVHQNQWIPSGDIVVSSELAYPVPIDRSRRVLIPESRITIDPALPLRLIGIDSGSGFSTDARGLWPFGLLGGRIDVVHADVLQNRPPALTDLPMNAPRADEQILSGIYNLEDGRWRWMAGTASLVLKSPPSASPLFVSFYIPDQAPARRLTIRADGKPVASAIYTATGSQTLTTPAVAVGGAECVVTLVVDKSFRPPGDNRELGVILTEVGFRK